MTDRTGHASGTRPASGRAARLVLGAIVLVPGLACGTNDAEVLERAATTSTASASPATAVPSSAVPASAAPTSAAAPTTSVPATPAPTASIPAGTFPAGAELAITFTYAATGERVRNPYVAVWIEDAAGELVRTVALHFQAGEGTLYLQALRRWFQVSGATPAQTAFPSSSATRPPGAYSVVWDGTDEAGRPVPNGTYHVCIEAVRDGGPYELIREPIAVGSGPFDRQLPPAQELVAAEVALDG